MKDVLKDVNVISLISESIFLTGWLALLIYEYCKYFFYDLS